MVSKERKQEFCDMLNGTWRHVGACLRVWHGHYSPKVFPLLKSAVKASWHVLMLH